MGNGVGEVLTFGAGVAISPAGIIAVILVLFSRRARVNGPLFLLGWVVALGVLSAVVYAISNQSNAGSSNTSSDSVSWLKIALGVGLLLLARREFRKRPEPGVDKEMPKWMKRVDGLTPIQALGAGAACRESEEPRSGDRCRCRPRPARAVDRRRRRRADRLGRRGEPDDRRPGRLPPDRGRQVEGSARGPEGLACPAQRRRDGCALPRLRRRPDREGHPAHSLRPRRSQRSKRAADGR